MKLKRYEFTQTFDRYSKDYCLSDDVTKLETELTEARELLERAENHMDYTEGSGILSCQISTYLNKTKGVSDE